MSGFIQLLSASFETVPWVWMTFLRTEKGGKHFKCFCKVFLHVPFVQSLNLPFPQEGKKKGEKGKTLGRKWRKMRGREEGTDTGQRGIQSEGETGGKLTDAYYMFF